MRVLIVRNKRPVRRWGVATLPVKDSAKRIVCVWAGPVYFTVLPKVKEVAHVR